ncbi:MAG: DUF3592 domain-containing protein [Candidatus Hydrogenedentes bacterium]|nr:DUF3592 domain-containing protein [Candidatus Hydrogenedentota bacterium]
MKTSTELGGGCLVLFALPFTAVGVGMAVWLVYGLYDWQQMQGWVETPAYILQAELEEHSDEDGSTYSVAATYQYEFDGRRYTGSRVAVDETSDNLGSFWEDLHRELQEYLPLEQSGQGKPYRAFVNPANPTEAVLNRDLRPGFILFKLVFVLAFGGVGVGLIVGGLFGARRVKQVSHLQSTHPDEPWQWRPEWAKQEIPAKGKTGMWGMIVFAVFWNVISVPIAFLAFPEMYGDHEWLPMLIVSIFPLVGLGLVAAAFYSVAQYRKYGESKLMLAQVPAVLGGPLRGVIQVPRKVRADEGFKLTLSCVERITTGSGKNRKTSENIKFQDVKRMRRELLENDYTRTDIPVLFGIPYNLPETEARSGNRELVWRLKAEAETPGVDYGADFEVPVFRTPESDPNFVLDDSAIAEYLAPDDDKHFASQGIQIIELPGERLQLYFPPMRYKGMSILLLIMALIFGGVGIGLFIGSAPWLFALIFTLAGALLLWGALYTLLAASRVTVDFDSIRIQRGLLAMGREQTIPKSDIASIESSSSMTYGSQQLWDILLIRSDQKKVKLAGMIDNQREAQALIDRIIARM